MDEPTIEGEIRGFLQENFPLADDPSSVPVDGSLIDLGIVDSTGVLELVGFIESRFGFDIPTNELTPENLDTVQNIVRYVRARLQAAATDDA